MSKGRGTATPRTGTITAASMLALAACNPAPEPPAPAEPAPTETTPSRDGRLAALLGHERRRDDAARDRYRNPAQTLEFFRVAPDQTVIEYAPGGGWYTRVLAPYLADYGRYVAIGFAPEGIDALDPYARRRMRAAGQAFPQDQSQALGMAAQKVPFHFSDAIPQDLTGSADRVLIIRMLHNLVRWGIAEQEIAALRKTLKPDGLVGVVQHRARPDAPDDYADGNSGYLRQEDVIALFEQNGFELVGTSEVNANPDDPADHEAGVWVLPPGFALGEEDRDRYAAIGESDRMTLLFRKLDQTGEDTDPEPE